MNTKIIWTVTLVVGAVVIALLWYATVLPQASGPANLQPTSNPPTSGPTSTTQPSSGSSSSPSSDPSFTIVNRDGNAVTVRDFLHNGTTVLDTTNDGRYLLAGNLGYCAPGSGACQAAPSTNYLVYYNSVPQSFTIALTEEPIGQARLDMEQFMLTTLGLSQNQLCNLNYLVGVTRYVSEQFTGKNLGFSFCPGATKLPL